MIPTNKEIFDQNLTTLETALGQKSPVNNKSFLRVLAAVLSLRDVGLYKLAVERALQNLASTATGVDLDLIGAEKSVIRKPAVACRVRITLNAVTDVIIPVTSKFVAAPNGLTYNVEVAAISVAGVATIDLACEITGTTGNLQVDDVLSIVSPIAGADPTGIVTSILTVGANEETENAFRSRVLFAQRSTTGGGNATDHKIWAEGVAGVVRAYPYAGKPAGAGTSYPGDRTVFVEADTSINADGIPLAGMLTEVRAAINKDPVTGKSRLVLGQTDATLYVQAITRSSFNVIITSLVTPAGQDATVKTAISNALTAYFLTLKPYVDGVDLEHTRNDVVTTIAVSEVVQSVIQEMGSSASGVTFKVGVTSYSTYTLAPGETGKLGTITYA